MHALSDSEVFRIAENVIDLGWGECPKCSVADRRRITAKVRKGRRFWQGLDRTVSEAQEIPEKSSF